MGEILMVQNLNLTLYSSLFVLVSMSMFISYSCLRVLPSLCLVISVLSRLLIFSFHLRLHLRVRLHPAFVCFFFVHKKKGVFFFCIEWWLIYYVRDRQKKNLSFTWTSYQHNVLFTNGSGLVGINKLWRYFNFPDDNKRY